MSAVHVHVIQITQEEAELVRAVGETLGGLAWLSGLLGGAHSEKLGTQANAMAVLSRRIERSESTTHFVSDGESKARA